MIGKIELAEWIQRYDKQDDRFQETVKQTAETITECIHLVTAGLQIGSAVTTESTGLGEINKPINDETEKGKEML